MYNVSKHRAFHFSRLWSGMVCSREAKPTRRELLKAGVISGGLVVSGLGKVPWLLLGQNESGDYFTGGKQVDTVEFLHEGRMQMDVPMGAELDGRLYTDLSNLTATTLITPPERFYLRTRASKLLPDAKSWRIKIDGLVAEPSAITVEALKLAAKPMGTHLMECAGNLGFARFGMISAAEWGGVALISLLENVELKDQATHVLISGFDEYKTKSASSVPGASWVFSREQSKAAGAFLATEMNSQALTADHGAPVRLVVPGWYGCTCIKWVDTISLVDRTIEPTSQMKEYAARTQQSGVPALASDYEPAIIEQAAMPIRVEKWLVSGKIKYRVVGIAWGGSRPVKVLEIRFNPDEDYVRVDQFEQLQNDPWTLWSHAWSPSAPGTYSIRLAVKEPQVRARRLDSGYYVRTVDITEV
jgi:DMSO/TMAO reductase YedYZ molybdopterin-dependent catalytic subunit